MAVTSGVPSAFFSYSREDSEFVLRLAGDLKATGANVWLDQIDILPGQRWDDAVERALADCPRMLVVLSPASVHSTNVMDEVSFALEKGKTVIPILHRECVIPFRLRRVQYIDLRQDYDHGLAELLKILGVPRAEAAGATVALDSRAPLVTQTTGREDTLEIGISEKDREAAEQVREPGSDRAKGKAGGVSPRLMMIKVGLAAGGVLIALSVSYWGLRRGQQKSDISPVVESAASKVESPIQPPPAQPKGDSETTAPTPAPPKASELPKIKPHPSDHVPDTLTPRAMFEKGMDYAYGRNESQDYQQAASWLLKASEAGHPPAMNNLAVLYANGSGVPQDYKQAATWYLKAAEAGYPQAMANLGSLYEKGNGVRKDSQKALDWYGKAAKAGNASAMYDLGAMYENGEEGLVKNPEEAIVWYRKAAEQGEQHAQQALKRLGLNQ